ncbi:hypothetical protein [Hyphomonas sp.]|uniref:hypothetical protein n=1 Tax=Hyphomonas TaxID=85 RepID=UPI00324232EA
MKNHVRLGAGLASAMLLSACGNSTSQMEGFWAVESLASMDCAGHLEDMGIKINGGDENFVAISLAGRVIKKFDGLTATKEDDGTITLASENVRFSFRQDDRNRLSLLSGPSGFEHNTLRTPPNDLVRCP